MRIRVYSACALFSKGGRKRLMATFLVALLALLALNAFVPRAARASFDLRSFLSSPQAATGDSRHRLGFKLAPSGQYLKAEAPGSMRSGMALGSSADLSAQLPPVGDQGNQGSCVAWATSYYYKSWSEKQEHAGWNLSDSQYQFSPSFVYNQINDGQDQGSNFPDAFNLLQSKGDVDIAEMPYNDGNFTQQPTAAELEAAKPYRIPSGWRYLWNQSSNGPFSSPNDIDTAKAWLNDGKLLVMGIPIYNDFPEFGTSPARAYYDYNGEFSLAGGHGVCISGYDDNINPTGSDAYHRGGFKMVNSWGRSWNGANAGYVYLSYDFARRYVWEAWTMGDLTGDGPSIDHLGATSGNAGDNVTIYGNNFGADRRNARVSFNGTNATQVSFSNSTVSASVPTGATSGPVIVYNWEGAPSNSVSFTVGGDPGGGDTYEPNDSVAGAYGPLKTNVAYSSYVYTINDNDYYWMDVPSGVQTLKAELTGTPTGCDYDIELLNSEGNSIGGSYNGQGASELIQVSSPSSGRYNLRVYSYAGYSQTDSYEVKLSLAYPPPRPSISGITPGSGIRQTWVTITGSNFGTSRGSSRVSFGSVAAASTDYTSWGNGRIVVRVPSGVGGRPSLTVTTTGGTSNGVAFKVIPRISTMSRTWGTASTLVTINGQGFGSWSSGYTVVYFGVQRAISYSLWSNNKIMVRVPVKVYGTVQVTVRTAGGTSAGKAFTVL